MNKVSITKNNCERSICLSYMIGNERLEIELSQKVVEIAVRNNLYFHSSTSDYPKTRYFYFTGRTDEEIEAAYEELKKIWGNISEPRTGGICLQLIYKI